jgi:hypothetical protein
LRGVARRNDEAKQSEPELQFKASE